MHWCDVNFYFNQNHKFFCRFFPLGESFHTSSALILKIFRGSTLLRRTLPRQRCFAFSDEQGKNRRAGRTFPRLLLLSWRHTHISHGRKLTTRCGKSRRNIRGSNRLVPGRTVRCGEWFLMSPEAAECGSIDWTVLILFFHNHNVGR